VQLFGPGVKRPGDLVQEVPAFISAAATTSSATYVALANQNVTISVQSAANAIRGEGSSTLTVPDPGAPGSASGTLQLSRGTVANTNVFGSAPVFTHAISGSGASFAGAVPISLIGYDIPNVTGNVTYAVQGKTTFGTITFGGSSQFAALEIQI
jgi:hypothetical protein